MNLWISSSTLHWTPCHPHPTTVYNKITTTGPSFSQKTSSMSLTNLMVLLPQSHGCRNTTIYMLTTLHSPILCHQPGLTNVTCTWTWSLYGITHAKLTTLLTDSRHHLQWVRTIPWQQPGILVDGKWVNKMESVGRSKSRKLNKTGRSFI